jgi:hypothetical protein
VTAGDGTGRTEGPVGAPRADRAGDLAGARAALLVEFINAGQFPGQIAKGYPFLQGWCRALGLGARWLRYGIATDNFFRHGVDAVTLSPAELDRLLAVARSDRPDVVFLTHALRGEQTEALRAAAPGVRVVVYDEFVDRELGRGGPEAYDVHALVERDDVRPDYRWEAGNAAAARRDRDNVYLLLRRRCGYREPVEENPLYAGLPLGPAVRTRGCAFCGETAAQAGAGRPGLTPVECLRRQLEALRASFPPDGPGGRRPNAVLMENLESAAALRTVAAELERLGFDDTKMLFGMRLDRLLALEETFRAELPRLAARGRAVHVYVLGLESFSDDQLLRLNKGFRGVQALAAVRLLRELEARWPGAFHFSGYMSLAMILFTPWTTLEELDLDLGLVAHLGLEATIGNLFLARLRLHPDLAVTALARKDGLLAADTSDEGLVLNRRKLFPHELPWRFRDPRLELVNSVAVRLEDATGAGEGDDDGPDDPLAGPVRALKARHTGPGWDRRRLVALLRAVAAAARTSAAPLPADELLRRAERLFQGGETAARLALPRTRFRLGEAALDLPAYLRRLVPLLDEGGTRALTVAQVDPAALTEALVAELAAAGVRAVWGAAAPAPAPTARGGGAPLHLARGAEQAERAQALGAAARDAGDPPAAAAARREAALLAGVPACCAAAWAESPFGRVGLPAWGAVLVRAAVPGPIDPWLSPFLVPDLAFVPCSAACVAAARRYRAWFERLGPEVTRPAAEARVLLVRLADLDQAATLAPARDGEWLRYAREDVRGVGALPREVARGERLRVALAQVQVWEGERVAAQWTAQVALWDPARAHAPEAWRELALAAQAAADPDTQRALRHAREAFRAALADPVTAGG